MYTIEPLVSKTSSLEAEITVEKLEIYKSPGIDLSPVELIQEGGKALRYEIHKLNPVWNKEEVPQQWNESVIVPICKMRYKTVCSNCSCLLSRKLEDKSYKTIILPVVLCGCETWSLTLRGEHILRVFLNRVLRGIFEPKRGFITCTLHKILLG
jgi:hypothetical protein